MPQIAGFRGALWDPSKVELAKVAAAPLADVTARLGRGELVRDASRALYRYHQSFELAGRTVTRKSLLAAIKLAPWSEGAIRPHEVTDASARDAAIAEITREGAHTDPVLVGYRDAARELDRLMRKAEDGPPTLDVTTPDATVHRLWRVQSAEVIGQVRTSFAPKKLHVLDGHARYEAMLAYHQRFEEANLPMYASANYGLACLVNVEDPALVVAPRHRIVHAAGIDRAAVVDAARQRFLIEKLAGAAADAAKVRAALAETVAHQPAFVAVFAGDPDAWKLTLSPDVSPVAEGVQVHRALQKYDPVVIEHLFFARSLPGAKVETTIDARVALAAVAGADAELALIVRPLAIDQILHADELGQVLPLGSTAFPPPLAHLAAFVVDPDEDLV